LLWVIHRLDAYAGFRIVPLSILPAKGHYVAP